jgi:hypothetical protein
MAPLKQWCVDWANLLCNDFSPWLLHTQLAKAIQVLIANVLAGGNAGAPACAAHPVTMHTAAVCLAMPNVVMERILLGRSRMAALCASAPAHAA